MSERCDFSNYAEQGLQFGKTVPYEVEELVNPDGTHPILHVEHLGDANASLLEEAIAGAKGAGETAPAAPLCLAEAIHANRERIRKHSVRRLDNAFFSDGTLATDAAIPGFIAALPAKALDRLLRFVIDAGNFYKVAAIAAKPAALAGE